MIIYPFTEERAREYERRSRSLAVHSLGFQTDKLQEQYFKRDEVNHNLLQRLVRTMLAIGAHIGLTPERAKELEAKIEKAGTGDSFTVHVEGSKIYLEGYFDLNKLRQEILW